MFFELLLMNYGITNFLYNVGIFIKDECKALNGFTFFSYFISNIILFGISLHK